MSDVEAMEDAMQDGGKDDTEEGDEDEATEEGIACGEEFGGGGGEFETVNGAHTAHEHRRFDDGIGPGKATDFVISQDSGCEGDGEKKNGIPKCWRRRRRNTGWEARGWRWCS